MHASLYSIGHGRRPVEELISLLKKNNIVYLADVRSKPFSRFNPQYNRNAIKGSAEQHAITYVFMGDTLGGRPEDPTCYDQDGKVDYSLLREKDFYHAGIERLKKAHEQNIPLAIMCSESKPEQCHRCLLIGKTLDELGIDIAHIDEHGDIITQQAAIGKVKKKRKGK